MFEICIWVGVVAPESPIFPNTCPSSSSVTNAGADAEFLIIVLSGPSPTKCAKGGMVSDAAILYVPAGKNNTLLALVSLLTVVSVSLYNSFMALCIATPSAVESSPTAPKSFTDT